MSRAGRPELGKLNVGDPVFVIENSNLARGRSREQRTYEAVVTEVRRVWCVLTSTGGDRSFPRTWKMRLDDQDEGDRMYPQNNDRFLTPEQYEHETAQHEADLYLREQGVRLDPRSPWDGREIELAGLLKAYGSETGSSDG